MSRSEVLLDLAYVLALGLVILVLSNAPTAPRTTFIATSPSASSTLAVVPSVVLPTLSLPSSNPVVSTSTLFLKSSIESKPAPAVSHSAAATSTNSLVSIPEAIPETPLQAAAVELRKALVNIMCYVPRTSGFRSISGSGVIIDPKGIILTNSHIGQFFLLSNLGVACVIRSGTPAVSRYSARPIYISRPWLLANPEVISETNPTGTGEEDYALIAISGSTNGDPLPDSYPYIPLAKVQPLLGAQIAVASYGSQSLLRDQVQNSLFPTVAFSTVQDVFTFDEKSVDVIELSGSSAAQKGSSGGGVAGAKGELVGLITTSSIEGDVSTRKIHAITGTYIRRAYAGDTGQSLDSLLSQTLSASIDSFASKIPSLEKIITDHL